MRYRADIDGLRAVAVVPVLFFHAGFGFFEGGFAGVDVFFVISGFLITSLIYDEIADGRFSLISFYERRARRIAPALLLVCLACIPFAWFWMLPEEANAFGKSLYFVNLFASNFLFWDEAGYFAASNELKPLLHTWSLAVEEQFYLLFPLLLWGLRTRSRRTVLIVVASFSAVSFATTQVLPLFDPVANFYLLPSRFWELGAGSLLAIAGPDMARIGARYGSSLAAAGLLTILASYLFVSGSSQYPGWSTVPVVVGTVLVLAFSDGTNWTGRILSFRPLVVIGLGSYSLYLWHQPVFAFARLRSMQELSPITYLLLIALTFGLAYISYRYVETPFRNRRRVSGEAIFKSTAAVGVVVMAVGATFDHTNGLPQRAHDLGLMTELSSGLAERCNGSILAECQTSEMPEVAVWGDSLAMHLVDGIISSNPSVKLVQLNKNDCGPFLNIAPMPSWRSAAWPQSCLDRNEEVRQFITKTPSLRYVAVAFRPTQYFVDGTILVRGKGVVESHDDVVLDDFRKTMDWLRSLGLQPVVFSPPPQDGRDPGICVARSRLIGAALEQCDLPAERVAEYDRHARQLLEAISRDYPVVDLASYLCDSRYCRASEDGRGLYKDAAHFSRQGSRYLGQQLDFYQAIQTAADRGCAPVASEQVLPPRGLCVLSQGGRLDLKVGNQVSSIK